MAQFTKPDSANRKIKELRDELAGLNAAQGLQVGSRDYEVLVTNSYGTRIEELNRHIDDLRDAIKRHKRLQSASCPGASLGAAATAAAVNGDPQATAATSDPDADNRTWFGKAMDWLETIPSWMAIGIGLLLVAGFFIVRDYGWLIAVLVTLVFGGIVLVGLTLYRLWQSREEHASRDSSDPSDDFFSRLRSKIDNIWDWIAAIATGILAFLAVKAWGSEVADFIWADHPALFEATLGAVFIVLCALVAGMWINWFRKKN